MVGQASRINSGDRCSEACSIERTASAFFGKPLLQGLLGDPLLLLVCRNDVPPLPASKKACSALLLNRLHSSSRPAGREAFDRTGVLALRALRSPSRVERSRSGYCSARALRASSVARRQM